MSTPAFNQARAAFERMDFATATRLCDAVLAEKRNDVNALILRGDIAGAQGHLPEELRYLERAVRLQPKNARLRVHFGHRFIAGGQPKKALLQFEKAAKLAPGNEETAAGLATAHEALDHYDRARRVLEPIVKRGNVPPTIAGVYLRVLLHDGDLEGAVRLGADVDAAGHPPSLDLRSTLFTLAKAYERSGAYPEALDAAIRANAMRTAPYDPSGMRTRVDRTMSVFTPETIARLAHPTTASETPVFIVGFPRCGSTLTERILHAHPQAFGAGEIDDLLLTVYRTIEMKQQPYPDTAPLLTTEDAEELAETYLAGLRRRAPNALRVSNKHLGNFMHLGLVACLFPGAKIIHTRRDAMDTCLSCFLERLSPAQAPYSGSLEHLGAHYLEYERMMAHWRDVLDLEILDVEYESLTTNQEAETRRILDFVGLPFDEACLRFHEVKRADATLSYDQVRRPMYRSSLGRAARYGALLDPLRTALGRPPFSPGDAS